MVPLSLNLEYFTWHDRRSCSSIHCYHLKNQLSPRGLTCFFVSLKCFFCLTAFYYRAYCYDFRLIIFFQFPDNATEGSDLISDLEESLISRMSVLTVDPETPLMVQVLESFYELMRLMVKAEKKVTESKCME